MELMRELLKKIQECLVPISIGNFDLETIVRLLNLHVLLINVRDAVDIQESKNEFSECLRVTAIHKNKRSDEQYMTPHDHGEKPLDERKIWQEHTLRKILKKRKE